ncbi:MAG: phosphate acyltransferase PlsX [Oscillospiraceae bacterium]|nr:phosphate acyltransferase PlsX [Oscillospiraceae bacterium]
MKIVIDGFGGDNAPESIIEGAVMAVKELGKEHELQLLITGDKEKLQTVFQKLKLPMTKIELVYANGVIKVEDNPMDIRTSKAGTSMGVAFDLVKKGDADAFVSAGSTAALVVGGSMTLGRIKDIKRPALSPIMPSTEGNYILLDGGANIECRPEMLLQFAIMGSVYMQKVMSIKNPRVGLLNVGAESEKGRELELDSYKLLKSASPLTINFVGNVEAREVPLGACDVLVTDGFTGNIYLKTVEGMGGFMKSSLRSIFGKNAASKIGYALSQSGVKEIRKRTDYREIGGSPLLGTAKPVIKAHGSSDAKAIKNAIKQAAEFVSAGVISEIENSLKND